MRPADAYRLKYRSSSQNSGSMEPGSWPPPRRRPTETNETAEARVVELDEIDRAARERERRAAHMRLPPPHKGRAKTSNAVLGFVFGLPNGVAWNVLSFWQCYYRTRTPNSSGLGGPDETHWHTGPW